MSLMVYLAAAVFGLSCTVLLRRPWRIPRDPLTLSTCAAIVLGSLALVCSAPLTLGTVNRLTGIPNFGAPLTYGMLSAYSCSLLVLLIHWRGGSPARIRRMVLRSMAAYGALIVAIVVLFTLADPSTERLTDLDTYYAGTPYMSEMIVLYLLGHSAATLALCTVCVTWAREVTGLLRTGLQLILLGTLLDVVGFQLVKYAALVARWTGHNLDFLSTGVAPPMASLAALTCSAGFALPRLLPMARAHWRDLNDLRGLGPLWSEVRFASIAPKPPAPCANSPACASTGAKSPSTTACWPSPLLRRPPPRTHPPRRPPQGPLPHEARVTAEAAMVADAARRAAAQEQPFNTPSTYRLYATEVSDTGGLVELARALAQSRLTATPAEAKTLADLDNTGA